MNKESDKKWAKKDRFEDERNKIEFRWHCHCHQLNDFTHFMLMKIVVLFETIFDKFDRRTCFDIDWSENQQKANKCGNEIEHVRTQVHGRQHPLPKFCSSVGRSNERLKNEQEAQVQQKRTERKMWNKTSNEERMNRRRRYWIIYDFDYNT